MSATLDQATADRICQLADRVGRLKEFDTIRGMRIREKGQKAENNMRRGIGVGLGGGLPGALAGAVSAHNYKAAGQVYRKREALGDTLAGAGVGAATSVPAYVWAASKGATLHPGAAVGIGLGSIGAAYLTSRALANRRLRKLQEG